MIAIAKSKNIARFGHVNLEIAKNDAFRPSVRAAQRDKKYNPNPDVIADRKITIMPGIKPTDANAAG